jgi:hypothetical protein
MRASRYLPLLAIVLTAIAAAFAATAAAEVTAPVSDARVPFGEGTTPQALTRAVDSAPSIDFRLAGGTQLHVASLSYDREQMTPIVGEISSLPHGAELGSLKVYAATGPEETALCGEGTMACYDPVSERMVISAETEEVAGISRDSVVAHEYGHHIANNRAGGIWPAFDAGTLRWSTYERVCERKREGLAFPGNEGAHYWENPGEAFAQSYSQLVDPQSTWNYSPLFAPTPTSLRMLREDVEDPVEPTESVWTYGESGSSDPGAPAIGDAVALGAPALTQELKVPYDGRIRVRLHPDGGRYRLALVDPTSGETVATAGPGAGGVTRLRYADCGERALSLVSTPIGASAAPFSARIKLP